MTPSYKVSFEQSEDRKGQKTELKKKRAKYAKNSLDSFLNSAMNIEYVYLILLGISNFMESTSYNWQEPEGNEEDPSLKLKKEGTGANFTGPTANQVKSSNASLPSNKKNPKKKQRKKNKIEINKD